MAPTIAVLWDDEVDGEGEKPFDDDNMDEGYRVFSEIAEERGASVFIGNFAWFDNGSVENPYVLRQGSWKKLDEGKDVDVIFDKFRFDDETVGIKRDMNDLLPVLNSFQLEEICKDKLLTAEKFQAVPETQPATRENVSRMLEDYGRAVLKPRYDFGGRGIKIVKDIEEFEIGENLLVQRFIDSKSGIPDLDIDGVHDLRVIVVNGEPVTSFVRTPNQGLISNVSRGGSMTHIEIEDVPESALRIVDEVEDVFRRFGSRVYAVDFIFDENGEPWILEMNSKPGLLFYDDESIRSWKEPLMEKVVETLIDMAD